MSSLSMSLITKIFAFDKRINKEGNELEYTDEITLGRSIVNRLEFKA